MTPAEGAITLAQLVKWAEKGVKPVSGDATLSLALASSESAAGYMTTTTSGELTFDEAILSAARRCRSGGGRRCSVVSAAVSPYEPSAFGQRRVATSKPPPMATRSTDAGSGTAAVSLWITYVTSKPATKPGWPETGW